MGVDIDISAGFLFWAMKLDPDQWRSSAQEMRDLAGKTDDLRSRRILLRIAADCERLALRIQSG
jgi:hypothetical protein